MCESSHTPNKNMDVKSSPQPHAYYLNQALPVLPPTHDIQNGNHCGW